MAGWRSLRGSGVGGRRGIGWPGSRRGRGGGAGRGGGGGGRGGGGGGGRTARDRLARFKARPRREVVKAAVAVAPVGQVRTPQKLAVLLALAMSWDVQQVADAAGMDVRTANWQRSRLVTLLGFCREST